MFRKLYKRIFNSLFWLAFAFVVLLSALSGFIVLRNLYNVYDSMSESSVRQAAMDGNNYLSSVANFARSAAQTSELTLALTEGRTENVSRVLTTLINSSSDVAGAVLYGIDGQTFYSTGVGDVPALSRLQQDQRLSEFFLSDEPYAILLRTDALPSVYNFVPYDARRGVISCVCKVYVDGGTVGYLFADVLSDSLFDRVLSVAGEEGLTAAVVTRSATVSSDVMPESDGLRNLVYCIPFASEGDFVFCLSLNEFYAKGGAVLAVIFAVDAVCIAAAAVVARHVARKVTEPLDRLRQTMQNENLLN